MEKAVSRFHALPVQTGLHGIGNHVDISILKQGVLRFHGPLFTSALLKQACHGARLDRAVPGQGESTELQALRQELPSVIGMVETAKLFQQARLFLPPIQGLLRSACIHAKLGHGIRQNHFFRHIGRSSEQQTEMLQTKHSPGHILRMGIGGAREKGKTKQNGNKQKLHIGRFEKLFKISYNPEKAEISGTGFRILFAHRGLFRLWVERCSMIAWSRRNQSKL